MDNIDPIVSSNIFKDEIMLIPIVKSHIIILIIMNLSELNELLKQKTYLKGLLKIYYVFHDDENTGIVGIDPKEQKHLDVDVKALEALEQKDFTF